MSDPVREFMCRVIDSCLDRYGVVFSEDFREYVETAITRNCCKVDGSCRGCPFFDNNGKKSFDLCSASGKRESYNGGSVFISKKAHLLYYLAYLDEAIENEKELWWEKKKDELWLKEKEKAEKKKE